MEDNYLNPIVSALLDYHALKNKKEYQMEKMQYTTALSNPNLNRKKGIHKNFLIPVQLSESIPDGANADTLRKIFREKICIYTWCDLQYLGNGKYKGMTDMAKPTEVPKHGGVGNKNKQKPLEDAYVSARNKIIWVIQNLACPFATRTIQNFAGVQHHQDGLSEDEVQPVYLPPKYP